MSKVSSLLNATHKLPLVIYKTTPETTVFEAAQLLRDKKIGALLVFQENAMVGILSERDIVWRLVAEGLSSKLTRVSEIMTKNPDAVTPFEDIVDCMNLMESKGFRHVPVVEKGQVVGIVSMRDILIALVRHQELLIQNFEGYIQNTR